MKLREVFGIFIVTNIMTAVVVSPVDNLEGDPVFQQAKRVQGLVLEERFVTKQECEDYRITFGLSAPIGWGEVKQWTCREILPPVDSTTEADAG